MTITLSTRDMIIWGVGLFVVVAAFLLPDLAFAGYCTSLSDCTGGSVTTGGAAVAGAGVGGGLVGLGTMDGGFTGNGDSVDFTAHAEPPPAATPPPAAPPSQSGNKFGTLQ